MFLVLRACQFTEVSPPTLVTALVLILYPRTLRLGKWKRVESPGQELAESGLQPKPGSPQLLRPLTLLGLRPCQRGRCGGLGSRAPWGRGRGGGEGEGSELPQALPRPLDKAALKPAPPLGSLLKGPRGAVPGPRPGLFDSISLC